MNTKNINRWFFWVFFAGALRSNCVNAQTPGHTALRVVIIRHAEKPTRGDNLNCQGLNRSMRIPGMLVAKFGVPDYTYVPAMGLDSSTRHSRMFQTIIPLAVKYNLSINTKFAEKDSDGVASDVRNKSGTVLMVWEHRDLTPVVRAFGIRDFDLHWKDDDYDSIWIITFPDGRAKISFDKEEIAPGDSCPF